MSDAKSMSNNDRAKKAAQERWNPTIPKATHYGLLPLGSVEIPCAIIKQSNGDVIRLLTENGMIKALGRRKGGFSEKTSQDLPIFIASNNLKDFLPSDLNTAGEIVEFRLPTGQKALGYRAELLPIICGVYLDAEREGKLLPQQKHLADICHILQKGFSTVGLISLVDEVCGYQKIRDSDALQKILEKYLNIELAKWAKRFPVEFYKEIYRLRNWAWNSNNNRYPVIGKYTKDLVYERLETGLLTEMQRIIPRNEDGEKKGCYHQLLTEDFGIPKLKEHFSALLAIMKLSKTWQELIANVNIVLPKKIEFMEKK